VIHASRLTDHASLTAAAHLPNSGRLGELLTPDRELRLARMPDARRKTTYDVKLAAYAGVWVSVDARLANRLFAEAWLAGRLADFAGYTNLLPEVGLGESRLDFVLSGPAGQCWVETKSVTLVEGGCARFPDAPTLRGQRHLAELAGAVRRGDRAAVVFIVQRPDAVAFAPHAEADPDFAQGLREAQAAGVRVLAYRCRVSEEEVVVEEKIGRFGSVAFC
jgi:sugar fermentation stimulation protein A